MNIDDVKTLEPEAAILWCSVKKVFLEIPTKLQENTCARVSFLIKSGLRPATLLKKRFWHRCFPVNFAKFLRTTFLQNTSGRLLLFLSIWLFKTIDFPTKSTKFSNSGKLMNKNLLPLPITHSLNLAKPRWQHFIYKCYLWSVLLQLLLLPPLIVKLSIREGFKMPEQVRKVGKQSHGSIFWLH